MSCATAPTSVTRPVWNNGIANPDDLFAPFVRLNVNAAPRLRVSFLLQEPTSSHLEVRPGLRYSDDGMTWGTPEAVGDFTNATTW